jgi:hypothetical protein
MPREVKHGRHAFLEEAVPSAQGALPEGASSALVRVPLPRRTVTARWFAALGPPGKPPAEGQPSAGRRAGGAAPLMLGALAVAALAAGVTAIRNGMAGGLVPLALVLAAGVVLWRVGSRGRSRWGLRPRSRWGLRPRSRWGLRPQTPAGGEQPSCPPASRGLELDGERLAFRAGSSLASGIASIASTSADTLLRLDAPFGVTLLASPRRDRVLALFSSATGTFYLGAVFDAAARRAFAPLLDRSFTVVGDDAGMDAIGPDGEPLVLAPDELASLLDALVEQSPTCLERFVLTDARGASLTLDGRHLCIGDRAVDLNAPLEWKPIVFQEAFGQMIAVYQGTWIRQSSTELTLVSLLPALGPAFGADLDVGTLDRAVLRDLRLMQASPEPPPPSEQRVAIDRLFMLQVRSALDRAPRASRQPDRAQA